MKEPLTLVKKKKQPSYPGLQANLYKAIGEGVDSMKELTARFPEAPKTTVAYHIKHLQKLRKIVCSGTGAGARYRLTTPEQQDGEAPIEAGSQLALVSDPPPVKRGRPFGSTTKQAVPVISEDVVLDDFTRHRLVQIEQRLQDAHDSDILFLRRMARR